jgi:hypothetical protein
VLVVLVLVVLVLVVLVRAWVCTVNIGDQPPEHAGVTLLQLVLAPEKLLGHAPHLPQYLQHQLQIV